MKKAFLPFILLAMLFGNNSYAQQKEEYILNENFDRNRLGWNEEYTSSHSTGIKDGFLYIISKDTSKLRTSNGPQNVSCLWDLPDDYEIISSISKLKGGKEAQYGMILISSTLTYKFSFSASGLAEVTENDYNKDEDDVYLFSQQTKFTGNADSVLIKVAISQRRYSLFINNEKIREGELKAKAWEGIRLFVSSGSGIKVDYLRIRKAK